MSEPITEALRERYTFMSFFCTTKLQINFESTKHRDEKNKLFIKRTLNLSKHTPCLHSCQVLNSESTQPHYIYK